MHTPLTIVLEADNREIQSLVRLLIDAGATDIYGLPVNHFESRDGRLIQTRKEHIECSVEGSQLQPLVDALKNFHEHRFPIEIRLAGRDMPLVVIP